MNRNMLSDQVAEAMQQEVTEKLRVCLRLYLRYEQWTVNQALCLLCGIDPESSQIEWPRNGSRLKIRSYVPLSSDRKMEALADHLKVRSADVIASSPELRELYRLESELADLQKIWVSGGRAKDRFPPAYFIQWAAKVGHEVRWLIWAEQAGSLPNRTDTAKVKSEKVASDADELNGKRRGSAYRLIAALLKKGYNLDVEGPKHGSVKELYDTLHLSGTEMDEDTFRRLIKAAAKAVQAERKRQAAMPEEKRTQKMLRALEKTEIIKKNRNT